MKNLVKLLSDHYVPRKALLAYTCSNGESDDIYLESYDISPSGLPVNPHPLTELECSDLAEQLRSGKSASKGFFGSKELIPEGILQVVENSTVIWHTKPRKVNLLFDQPLGIDSGLVWVPGLLWKATKKELYVYALACLARPDASTRLYHAPFFNIYADGRVCMGTVHIDIPSNSSLHSFINNWQDYFFKSTFTHLLIERSPVKGNIIRLWNNLVSSGARFPVDQLVYAKTLESILS